MYMCECKDVVNGLAWHCDVTEGIVNTRQSLRKARAKRQRLAHDLAEAAVILPALRAAADVMICSYISRYLV